MPIYLKYGKLKGSSTEAGHEQWIPLIACEIRYNGLRNKPSATAGSTKTIREILCTRVSDGLSTQFWNEALNGNSVAATLDMVTTRASGDDISEHFKLVMTNARVASFNVSVPVEDREGLALERFSVICEKAQGRYYLYDHGKERPI